ncbi:hypothetical protein EVAR_64340_1 [Eumeta japonica]|uniref:Uncharacterized protein n=1 Tax=Eumeta variegata TaxID=151549 RepID=A0A4C1ZJ87_EUMVA|nr:hypothetical protein EVAR_64340_1 [Eumeta japonica]
MTIKFPPLLVQKGDHDACVTSCTEAALITHSSVTCWNGSGKGARGCECTLRNLYIVDGPFNRNKPAAARAPRAAGSITAACTTFTAVVLEFSIKLKTDDSGADCVNSEPWTTFTLTEALRNPEEARARTPPRRGRAATAGGRPNICGLCRHVREGRPSDNAGQRKPLQIYELNTLSFDSNSSSNLI